ncbi:alpha-(1,3)-fucosyltransferase 7-like [Pectinophora gossypiella]|uniref:alpha-(1,3)-fucosyltransferase 7-like n=1 Tax=Pectinophora gossypiella TaxID=13191 RepID=UPI00214EC48F|nr:alpha-(1,3)-fucosyltransferase 7-like [Pectinophora gossypiella]
MTFRSDSDIPVPYGRTVPLPSPVDVDLTNVEDALSKCIHAVNAEWRPNCNDTDIYIFYLVFENSSCRQYMTEKLFHHAYAKGAIPVILGPPLIDCLSLLPPNSFLHVDSYKSLKDLNRK